MTFQSYRDKLEDGVLILEAGTAHPIPKARPTYLFPPAFLTCTQVYIHRCTQAYNMHVYTVKSTPGARKSCHGAWYVPH